MIIMDDIEILKSNLEKYKELTLKLIASMETEDFGELDYLLEERQGIINAIEELNYDSKIFKQISLKLDLMLLQKKLTELVKMKKNEVKNEIERLGELKVANKSYKKKFVVDSLYFNKKI